MNQIVGCHVLLVRGGGVRVEHMKPNVAFDHLGHQGIHRAPAGRDVVKYLGTFGLLIESAFNRFHLPANPPDAIQ